MFFSMFDVVLTTYGTLRMDIVSTGMLGSLQDFRKAYANPLRRNNKEKVAALLKIIQPFILRWTKSEVAPELLSLTEKTIYCSMSESQAKSYDLEMETA